MSHRSSNILLSVAFLFLAAVPSFAQTGNSIKENMPYSRYGLGEFRNPSNTMLRGMGSASAAYNNRYAVNADNPASYAFLKLTTYEAAGEGSLRNITNGIDKYSTGSATVAYLNIGIPLAKHAGMAFGLRPVSRVYYNLSDTLPSAGFGQSRTFYTGEGGLNYAFLGGAYEYKGFSLGVNGGYQFGTLRHTSGIEQLQTDSLKTLNSEFSQFDRIGGLYWQLGAQYYKSFKEKYFLSLGSTLAISQHLNVTRDNYSIAYRQVGLVRSNIDSIVKVEGQRGKIKLPTSLTFGAQVGGLKWALMVDARVANWGDYTYFNKSDTSAAGSSSRYSIGGEYTPSRLSVGVSYLQRVTYRLGGYYGKDYLTVNTADLNYYGFTVGASLPFKRGLDRVHTAFEIGQRGNTNNGLIKETFYKFTLGVTLNDLWFQKSKYD